MLFDNLSPKTDFSSKLQLNKLEILNKNILYVTHQTDKILKILNKMIIDDNLQNTVDKYFERDETSPQTDTREQNDMTFSEK